MTLFPEKSGIGNVGAPGSEDPRQQFLAANSAGWGTSTPTRPERQENEAGTTVDSQLEAWTTRVPPKVDWAARRQPCAGRSIERQRGGSRKATTITRRSHIIERGMKRQSIVAYDKDA